MQALISRAFVNRIQIRNCILMLLLSFAQFQLLCVAQGRQVESLEPGRVESLVSELKDPSWETRQYAFYLLVNSGREWTGRTDLIPRNLSELFASNPGQKEEVVLALVTLLETENSTVRKQSLEFQRTGKTLTEPFVNYYGDVIASVASLRDRRALNALLGAADTGNLATKGIAQLGNIAVDPTLKLLEDSSPTIRSGAVSALGHMLEATVREQFGDAASKHKVRTGLLKAAHDGDIGVRIVAVNALALIPDPEIISLLERLADSDPAALQTTNGKKEYPVRQAAQRSLREISLRDQRKRD